ncbi:WD40 repeat protein [Salix suchowensis]|nr:WD40 repeat protein [Salix suchowensis]
MLSACHRVRRGHFMKLDEFGGETRSFGQNWIFDQKVTGLPDKNGCRWNFFPDKTQKSLRRPPLPYSEVDAITSHVQATGRDRNSKRHSLRLLFVTVFIITPSINELEPAMALPMKPGEHQQCLLMESEDTAALRRCASRIFVIGTSFSPNQTEGRVQARGHVLSSLGRGRGYLRELDPNYILEDPPRCLVGTRQDIISGIIDWAKNDDPARIVWLHAYPGAGKSTVASTVAQLNPVLRSLASGLLRTRAEVSRMQKGCRGKTQGPKPRLAHATAKEIFKEFVEQPLLNLAERPPEPLPVFVIDGLDEYSSVEGPPSQLYSCIKHLALLKLPLKLVVTSRFEDSIRGMFACFPHFPITIGTGDKADAQSNNDIHLFFEHEFKIISEDSRSARLGLEVTQ